MVFLPVLVLSNHKPLLNLTPIFDKVREIMQRLMMHLLYFMRGEAGA